MLFVFTDQQSASMMSCAGNSYLKTPAMDGLAAAGVRFERAYCTNPVCLPSRFSLLTGRMPYEIGVRHNGSEHEEIPAEMKQGGLGHLVRAAGYETAYGGKVHLPGLTPEELGFEYISQNQRDGLADACAAFLGQKRHKPFFLVTSFINPHDICFMAIRDHAATKSEQSPLERQAVACATLNEALELPAGMSEEEFFASACPPLPDNFEPQADEPEAVRQIVAQHPFKKNARENYDERRWRLHRWAFCRLTERVDRQIGTVLDALRASGERSNTVVIFSSDHGDMDAAHRMEHKTALYEEACRVPLIISAPGGGKGTVEGRRLVSNGLDLLPTICDYAGAEVPASLAGRSLKPLVEGEAPAAWRQWLPVECEFGRMIVGEKYKYVLYDEGEHREQFIDLEQDPGEMRNLVGEPALAEALDKHREMFGAKGRE